MRKLVLSKVEGIKILKLSIFTAAVLVVGFLASTDQAQAAAPILHDADISLNGTWDFYPSGSNKYEMIVPGYWDAQGYGPAVNRPKYERTVTVPATWAGKVVKLDFRGVNHAARVYVDGQFVGEHIGAWTPFSLDISDKVVPGSSFILRVDVLGGSQQPIVDANGVPQWPVGYNTHVWGRWGFSGDVWLRAYDKIHIEDAHIKTSYRDKKIEVAYTLKNSDAISHTISIEAEAKRNGVSEKTFSAESLTLAAGETKEMILNAAWSDPAIWMPDEPNLYILNSKIKEGGVVSGEEHRRFGFREIWILGNQFYLNGVRTNLLGDSVFMHAWTSRTNVPYEDRNNFMTPEKWPSSIDKLLAMNIRMVRFHQEPIQEFALEEADERGLMVIEETPIFAGGHGEVKPTAIYLENSKKWIGEWVKARRNHPAILLWSAENENGVGWKNWITKENLKSLGDEIRKYDTTRPVTYDGDENVGDAVVNYHYLGTHQSLPSSTSSIYQWANKIFPDKPTGVGEFLFFWNGISAGIPQDSGYNISRWWQGLMTRGLRYTNFTDIRPFTLAWTWASWSSNPPTTQLEAKQVFMKNSLAPVALFDVDYDDLKTPPLETKTYPSVNEGATVTRKLALYNDEFRDAAVTVEVIIKSGATVYATGSKVFSLANGEHMDIPISFQAPFIGNSNIEMTLVTKKKGITKFTESKYFKVNEIGLSGGSSDQVLITGGVLPQSDADVNGDGRVNIKDIRICIKAIVDRTKITDAQYQKCLAVAPPETVVNIKDIQAIVRAIIGG